MSKIPYALAIESLMYAILCTQPDIFLTVSVTSKYQSNPREKYWIAIKNILKYLRRTKDLFLVFGGGDLQVQGYTDSDFMSDIDDKKSTSYFVFLCNGGMVSWKSFKQPIIADSIIETEYIAVSEAIKKRFWFKKFIVELGLMPLDTAPLFCDNNGVLALAKESRSHKKSKHIERWFYLICEYLEKKFIEVQRVDSTENAADPLIKPLSQYKTEAHFEKMRLRFMVNWF